MTCAVGTRGPSSLAALLIGGATTISYLLPVFLTGALAVSMREELAMSMSALGVAVGVYWGVGTLSSLHAGRLVDRIGSVRSLRLSTSMSLASSMGIALTAQRWQHVAVWLALGGLGLAVGQPAANRLLANAVTPRRLGRAFGLKQSSAPAATLLAGISVPLIAATIGWRWAFAGSGAVAAFVLLSVIIHRPGRLAKTAATAGVRRLANAHIVALLAVGFGLSVATASVLTSFYVDAAVQIGLTVPVAGWLLALASLAAIVTRIGLGVVADRVTRGHLRICATLLVVGSFGIGLLAVGNPIGTIAGVIIAMAGCWGMNGVFWFSLVRAYADTPGRVTGAVAPGAVIGSMFGPMIFGVTVERTSFFLGWVGLIVVTLISAIVLGMCARILPEAADAQA